MSDEPRTPPPVNLFAPPPPSVRPAPPPLAVRLAPLPRMALTLAAALAGAWRVAAHLERVAGRAFPDSEPAPRLAAEVTVAAMVLFLLGVWAWLEPVMVRGRLGALARFGVSSLGCLIGACAVAALPLLYISFFALFDTPGARSAVAVLLRALVAPLVAWVPAFWLGELAGAAPGLVRRARPGWGNARGAL